MKLLRLTTNDSECNFDNILNSDLIIFPELSITGYEPSLAKKYVTNVENSIFDQFQELSDKNEITIGVGIPTNAIGGIYISMLICNHIKRKLFIPNKCYILTNYLILLMETLKLF